ncbi:MAG: hypothetical protein RLZZ116_1808 [Planctomycetota bacterium]|jgi:hypothetical protein
MDGVRHDPVGVAPSALRARLAVGLSCAAFLISEPMRASSLNTGLYSDEALARGIDYYVAWGMFSGGGQFGCGVAVVDLDQDGDDDIVCLGAQDERVGFYRNDGTGHFENRSLKAGIGPVTKASGIAVADYDADGDLDIAITRWLRSTVLLRNNGNFTFTDVSASAGVTGAGAGAGCSWADFDGDGWIDLSVANRTGTLGNQTRNRLFRNNGNGTFTDVAVALGVDNGTWPAFTASWCDVDLDGDQDLYVGNDKGTASPFTNRLYRNNGDGSFFEDTDCRADVRADAMGVTFADVTHDGVPEIYVSNLNLGNFLLTSQDQGVSYISVAEPAGVECNVSCWGSIAFDPDSDGRQDLFVLSQIGEDFLFMQGQSWPFIDSAFVWGLNDPGEGYCVAVGDIDRDGDPDLLVQNYLQKLKLYVNNMAPQPNRRWIEFSAKGRGKNTFAIGTRMVVTAGGRTHWCDVASGNSYKSQSTYRQRVGLGNVQVVEQVAVMFPKAGALPSVTRVLRNLPTNLEWPLWPPESLGDADGSGVRTLSDRAQLQNVIGAACSPELARFDLTGDTQLDADDLAEFDRVQCDLDGDGVVGFRDLATVLHCWGDVCADFDGSGATGPEDLTRLIAGWSE